MFRHGIHTALLIALLFGSSLFGAPIEPDAVQPIDVKEMLPAAPWPTADVPWQQAVTRSTTILRAKAKDAGVVTKRWAAHMSTTMNVGDEVIEGGGTVVDAQRRQVFSVVEVLAGKHDGKELTLTYGYVEKSDCFPGPETQSPVPIHADVLLLLDSKGRLVKVAVDTDTNRKNLAAHAGTDENGLVTLRGTVIEKPWTKSLESWNAGGSEYYVLDVGDVELPPGRRSAKEGVILRPSKAVPFEQFHKYKGKRVVVSGKFVDAKPYTPADPAEQIPMEPDVLDGPDGKPILGPAKPARRGSGFEVHKIQLAKRPLRPTDAVPIGVLGTFLGKVAAGRLRDARELVHNVPSNTATQSRTVGRAPTEQHYSNLANSVRSVTRRALAVAWTFPPYRASACLA